MVIVWKFDVFLRNRSVAEFKSVSLVDQLSPASAYIDVDPLILHPAFPLLVLAVLCGLVLKIIRESPLENLGNAMPYKT